MDALQRRKRIVSIIMENKKPISASKIATLMHVSRQIIVGDVALLRASGFKIIATPRGYVMETNSDHHLNRTIAVVHTQDELAEELYTIIEQGGGILDVIVEHPIYGQLCANLHLFSKYDVDQFLMNCDKEDATPLSLLTNGVHLHTIRVQDEQSYGRILSALQEKNMLYTREK